MRKEFKNIASLVGACGKSLTIDANSRYRLICESEGTRKDILFSVPISDGRGELVDLNLYDTPNGNGAMLSGATLIVSSNQIRLRNSKIEICVTFEGAGGKMIRPTLNGVLCSLSLTDGKGSLRLSTDKIKCGVRSNLRYFALMESKFRPYFVISAIGIQNSSGEPCCPVDITHTMVSDGEYEINFFSDKKMGSVMLEINMYEEKLFLDTTVESKNPDMNNAFGTSAFIGADSDFGEAWLYTRPDFLKLDGIGKARIKTIKLYLPILFNFDAELELFAVVSRFCSFGSRWSNKKGILSKSVKSEIRDGYLIFDVSSLVIDDRGFLARVDGFVVKASAKNKKAAMIATGDSFAFPQIMSIEYL